MKSIRTKHLVQLLFGIAISAVALYYVFRDVRLQDMIDSFREVNYWYLIPATLMFYAGVYFRGLRWSQLFLPRYRVPLRQAVSGMFVCFAFNSVFPARAGEFARAYLVGRKANTGFSTAFGTVVAERLLDTLTLLPCLVIALMIAPISPESHLDIEVFGNHYSLTGVQFAALQGHVIRVAIVMFFGILLILLPLTRRWILRIIERLPMPRTLYSRIESMLEQFVEGANCFRNPWRLAWLFVLSFITWTTTACSGMLLAWGFPDMPMTFVQAFAMVVIICIFIIVPAAPGYWGFFEAGVIFSVVMMGVRSNDAVVRSYAILLHLTQWVPIVAIGLPLAWFSHVSLSAVEEKSRQIEEPRPGD